MSKQFNTRIQHKIDTYENWSKAENFKPLKGELIIYTTDEKGTATVKFKVGDGENYINDLEFAAGGSMTGETDSGALQSDWAQTDSDQLDYIKNKPGDTAVIEEKKLITELNIETSGIGNMVPGVYIWGKRTYTKTMFNEGNKVVLTILPDNISLVGTLYLNPDADVAFNVDADQTGYYATFNLDSENILVAYSNGFQKTDETIPYALALNLIKISEDGGELYIYPHIVSSQNDLENKIITLEVINEKEEYIKLSNNALNIDLEPIENSDNLITSGSIYNALKNIKIPEVVPQVQSDFLQNDSTQPDYIKNRIAYKDDLKTKELLSLQSYEFAYDDSMGIYSAILEISPLDLELWSKLNDITVSWDGINYNLSKIMYQSCPCWGNPILAGLESTSEPFTIAFLKNEDNGKLMLFSLANNDTHTIGITYQQNDIILNSEYFNIDNILTIRPGDIILNKATYILESWDEEIPNSYIYEELGSLYLPNGKNVCVTWNGVEYICKVINTEDGFIIGNFGYINDEISETDEPFIIFSSTDNYFSIISFDGGPIRELSITAIDEFKTLIDKQLLDLKMEFDPYPMKESENFISSGAVFSALGGRKQILASGEISSNDGGFTYGSQIYWALGQRSKLEFDSEPKENSNNLMTSGSIYTTLQNYSNNNGSDVVTSVNGKTGIVNLTADDIGALPNTTIVPTKVTDLTDKDNYYTKTEVNNSLANKQNIQTISLKGNTGSETWYYPLGKMVIDNSGNYGNYIFNGRFGGWVNNNSATYSIMLMNRGAYDGNSITSTVSAAGVYDAAISIVDIVVSKNDDLSHDVYLACTGYYLFDFAWTAFQHEITYNGTYTTTAPSNIIWRLSTAPKTILNEAGKFSASGGITVSASDITSGILSTTRGGTGYSSIVDTTYTTARYRASSLNSTETNPSDNGVIAWTYE